MPRTAGLHPHAEGLKKVTGADKTRRRRVRLGMSAYHHSTGPFATQKPLWRPGARHIRRP